MEYIESQYSSVLIFSYVVIPDSLFYITNVFDYTMYAILVYLFYISLCIYAPYIFCTCISYTSILANAVCFKYDFT